MNWEYIIDLTEAPRLAFNVQRPNINDTHLFNCAECSFLLFIVLTMCGFVALVCLRLELTNLRKVFSLFRSRLTLIFAAFYDGHEQQGTHETSLHNIVYEIIFAKGQLQNKSAVGCGQAFGSQHIAYLDGLRGNEIGLICEIVSIIDAACRLSQRKVCFWSIRHNETYLLE